MATEWRSPVLTGPVERLSAAERGRLSPNTNQESAGTVQTPSGRVAPDHHGSEKVLPSIKSIPPSIVTLSPGRPITRLIR